MKYRLDKHQLLYKLGKMNKSIDDLCAYLEIDMQSMYRRLQNGFRKSEVLLIIVYLENVSMEPTDLEIDPVLTF